MTETLFTQTLNLTSNQFDLILAHLQKSPGFMYLDSANNRSFSLCVWQPIVTIDTLNSQQDRSLTTCTYANGEQTSHNSDPLALIQNEVDKLPIKHNETLPFFGGAIGYWGYEFGGCYERLPKPRKHEITMPDMSVGVYASGILVDHDTGEFQYFSQQGNPEVELKKILDIVNSQPTSVLKNQASFILKSQWQSNMTLHSYREKFNKVKNYLASGDCYQINLAQRFNAQYEGSEWQAYLLLREENKAPFSSFIRTKDGAVLSLSPERFVQVNNNNIETKPIKGTRPRSLEPIKDQALADDLASAPKDRAENLMIVDLLRNDLSKVAVPGSVKVPSLFAIESYPAVHHLVSTITAVLKPGHLAIDLLRGAFPGGSITGAPKIRAMEIIHELEPHPRSVYCGAIGYIKPNGNMDTNITIRTLVCNNDKIYCWAGGGLVADSVCEDEYQETLDKVNKILPILSQSANYDAK